MTQPSIQSEGVPRTKRFWAPSTWLQLPTACPVCALTAANGGLCQGCWRELLRVRRQGKRCERCSLLLTKEGGCLSCAGHPPAFTKAFVAFDYAPPADVLVHQLKERGRIALAWPVAQVLAAQLRQSGLQSLVSAMPPKRFGCQSSASAKSPKRSGLQSPTSVPLVKHSGVNHADPYLCNLEWWVVPIPSRAASRHKRGYNPAAVLARALARCLGIRYQPCLHEVSSWFSKRNRQRQKYRNHEERQASDAPNWRCRPIPAQVGILLVDDVLTSGSTLHHAAEFCLQSGAKIVYAAVAARTPWPNNDEFSDF